MNIDFELDLTEKVNALPLSDDDRKRVVDIVFWAMEQVAQPKAHAGEAKFPIQTQMNVGPAVDASRAAEPRE